MKRLLLAVVAAAVLAGCGGSSPRGGPDEGTPGPSAKGAPVDASGQEEAYQKAVAAFEEDDFDVAIPAMEALSGYRDADARVEQFRVAGARTKIRIARRKLNSSPQASVVQLRTALRYHPTAEARALLVRAERALAAFKRKEEAKRRRKAAAG